MSRCIKCAHAHRGREGRMGLHIDRDLSLEEEEYHIGCVPPHLELAPESDYVPSAWRAFLGIVAMLGAIILFGLAVGRLVHFASGGP